MGSKFQERVKGLIKSLLGTAIREEVNVRKLFPEYIPRNHHYDLVINSYNLIVECHGEQHRNIQSFGEKNTETVIVKFQQQRYRDGSKENIARENEWGYLKIWYNSLPRDDSKAIEFLRKEIAQAIEEIGH